MAQPAPSTPPSGGCLLALAFANVVLFLLGAALGLGMIFAPRTSDDAPAGAFVLVFFSVLFFLPAYFFARVGFARRRRLRRLERFAALAAARSRTPLAEFARDSRMSEAEAKDVVLDAVSLGYMRGRLDVEDGVFVSMVVAGAASEREVKCGSCGAKTSVMPVPGEAAKCPYCGSRLAT